MSEFVSSMNVAIRTAKSPNQMIVNGQVIEQTMTVICCPNCNKILQQFGGQVPPKDLANWFSQNKNALEQELRYCSKCGQKLSYNYDIIELSPNDYEVKEDEQRTK